MSIIDKIKSPLNNHKKKKFIETVLSQKITIVKSTPLDDYEAILKKCELRLLAVSVFNRPNLGLVYDTDLAADIQTVKNAIGKAKTGDKSELGAAKLCLEKFDGKVKTALAKAKGDAQDRTDSAAVGPKYDFYLRLANIYLNRITPFDNDKGVALGKKLTPLSTLPREPARAKLTYKRLKALVTELWELDKKVSGKAEGEVGNPAFKEARKSAEIVLAKLREKVPPVEVGVFEKQISDCAKKVAINPKNAATEKVELETHTHNALQVLTAFERAEKECISLRPDCERIVQGMLGAIPPETAAKFQSRWDSIEILLGLHEFAKAKAEMANLKRDFKADPTVATASQKKRDWNDIKGAVGLNLTKLGDVIRRLARADTELAKAGLLLQKLHKANDLGKANDFAAALAALPTGDWQKEIADLVTRADESEKLVDKREAANKEFSKRRVLFEAEIKKLEDVDGDGSHYVTRLGIVQALLGEHAGCSASTEAAAQGRSCRGSTSSSRR